MKLFSTKQLFRLGALLLGAPVCFLWAACSPYPPSPRLLYIDESAGTPSVVYRSPEASDTPIKMEFDGSFFPGPPDPKGTHAMLIRASPKEGQSIWLVPLAGGIPHQMTQNVERIKSPAWGPNGDWFVFETGMFHFSDIARVERKGSRPKRLTQGESGDFSPDVRADGRIVFVSGREGNSEVFSMNTDGSDQVRLTHSKLPDSRPKWSPDGSLIAWITQRGYEYQTWIMTDKGGSPRRLRKTFLVSELDREVYWSPDGTAVAVVVELNLKDRCIDIINVKTGERVTRIDGPGPDENPAWSPDGQWLVFSSSRAGHPDLWMSSKDGATLKQLTNSEAAQWLPRWLPPKK